MKVHIKGEFLKNDVIQKKDGTAVQVAYVLVDDEAVKINRCRFANKNRLDPVELDVNVQSSEYGLYITPIKND